MRRICCIALLGVFVAGCYASHERAADAGRDGGLVDARMLPLDAGPPDLGPPTPLPVEPDPDYGPDTPPSGYPDAMDWTEPDPSAYPPDEPALLPLGEVRHIAMPGHGALGDLDIEWNGTRWGLLYADSERTSFMTLEPLGAPAGALVDLALTGNISASLAWSGGRFAVAVTTGFPSLHPPITGTVGFLDANGVRTSDWNAFSPAYTIAMARATHLDRWVVAFLDPTFDLRVRELGTDASWLGEPQWLAQGVPNPVQIVGLKSRAVTFSFDPVAGLVAHVLRFPLASHVPATQPLYPSEGRPMYVAAAPFRDVAVLADSAGAPEGTRLTYVDAWNPSETRSIDLPTDSFPWMPPGLGASSRAGLVALCLPIEVRTDRDAPVELWVYLFDSELRQLGARTMIGVVRDFAYATSCEVAFSSEGILVAWWTRQTPGVWVRPMAPRGAR